MTTVFRRRIGIMKEFRSFPIKGGKLALDKSVDDAIQAIVANAKKYKEQMNTSEPQRQALFSTINCRKVCHLLLVQKKFNYLCHFLSVTHVFWQLFFKKKQIDVRNPLQLQYFNLAPTYVTRVSSRNISYSFYCCK